MAKIVHCRVTTRPWASLDNVERRNRSTRRHVWGATTMTGYDPATGICSIPDVPTTEDATSSLIYLQSILSEYAHNATPGWADPMQYMSHFDDILSLIDKVKGLPSEIFDEHPTLAEVVRRLILART